MKTNRALQLLTALMLTLSMTACGPTFVRNAYPPRRPNYGWHRPYGRSYDRDWHRDGHRDYDHRYDGYGRPY